MKIPEKMTDQSSTIYGLAFLGALFYFIQHAATFWAGILGVLKAIVWPAVLIYKLFEFLKL
ncbi:hypothetical protein [Pedobacter panaciterrae]